MPTLGPSIYYIATWALWFGGCEGLFMEPENGAYTDY